MAAHVGAKSQADNKRCIVQIGERKQITDSHHDIIFLIRVGIFSYKEEISQVLFGRLQFDNSDVTVWRGAGKTSIVGFATGRNGSQHGSVTVCVCSGNQFARTFRTEGCVDLVFCILCSIAGRKYG